MGKEIKMKEEQEKKYMWWIVRNDETIYKNKKFLKGNTWMLSKTKKRAEEIIDGDEKWKVVKVEILEEHKYWDYVLNKK